MTTDFSRFKVFGNSAQRNLLTQVRRGVTSFSSRPWPPPPRIRDTTPPSCDADARFLRTRAIPSAWAFHVFCRPRENRCERQNHRRAKRRDGQAEKSKAS